jgi:hypothetical protein
MDQQNPQASVSATHVPALAETGERDTNREDSQPGAEAQLSDVSKAAEPEAQRLAEELAKCKKAEAEARSEMEEALRLAKQGSEEKQQLDAAKAKLREGAEAALKATEGVSALAGNEGAKNRAVKELKTALDEHRRRYDRGKKLWRVWSLLSFHMLILSIAGAIFVNWAKLSFNNSPIKDETRSDIVLGLTIIAVVSLFLFLEYLRNWRKFRLRAIQVDKLIVELTKSNAQPDMIEPKLEKIIEKHLNFIGSLNDINKA